MASDATRPSAGLREDRALAGRTAGDRPDHGSERKG
jgi:hypothetical protein